MTDFLYVHQTNVCLVLFGLSQSGIDDAVRAPTVDSVSPLATFTRTESSSRTGPKMAEGAGGRSMSSLS